MVSAAERITRARRPDLWRALHPDEPALNLLMDVLSANRSAILDEALSAHGENPTEATRRLEGSRRLAEARRKLW